MSSSQKAVTDNFSRRFGVFSSSTAGLAPRSRSLSCYYIAAYLSLDGSCGQQMLSSHLWWYGVSQSPSLSSLNVNRSDPTGSHSYKNIALTHRNSIGEMEFLIYFSTSSYSAFQCQWYGGYNWQQRRRSRCHWCSPLAHCWSPHSTLLWTLTNSITVYVLQAYSGLHTYGISSSIMFLVR